MRRGTGSTASRPAVVGGDGLDEDRAETLHPEAAAMSGPGEAGWPRGRPSFAAEDGSGSAEGPGHAEATEQAPEPRRVDRSLLEFLVCPVTRGPLVYDAERDELVSRGANRAFRIQDGIPIMLVDEARALDE